MRRQLCLILAMLLLLSLCGCSYQSVDTSKPAAFYYTWADLEAKMEKEPDCGAIGSELRETSTRAGDINYLLALYMRGPLDPELKSPFPAGCRVVSASVKDDTLCVTMDASFARMENVQLTLACACLAKTCFSLADVTQVQITSETPDGNKAVNITIGTDSLLLTDLTTPDTTEDSK